MQMKRAPDEKECSPLKVSRLRHNSANPRSSSNEVPLLPQRIAANPTDSRRVERRNQRKRHRHVRNNFGALTPAAP